MKTLKCRCGKDIQIDNEDYERTHVYIWTCLRNGTIKSGDLSLADLITNFSLRPTVDHKDRDKHNNQKLNLRAATYSQNNQNRGIHKRNVTGFKGVSFDAKARRAYRAYICLNGKQHYLGAFETAREAASAYNEAAKRMFGEFAQLNDLNK